MSKKLNLNDSHNEDNCLFCKIVKKEINTDLLYEDKYAIAFLDINPIADGHTLVITKNHYQNVSSAKEEDIQGLAIALKNIANMILNSKLKPWGLNYLSNENEIAGQQIMHLHFHIIPKYAKNEGLVFENQNIDVSNIDKIYKKLIK